ncbi:MAG: hypothetical protein JRI36_02810 [Deltaproteobacteria bacterium]|nr:hypothetical protein [Deltaproteobacteria bacterium]
MRERLLNVQHRFNPLHVHCRLVERGVNQAVSLSICRWYEALVYGWLAWLSVVGIQLCKVLRAGN